jgi:neutral ceramidase
MDMPPLGKSFGHCKREPPQAVEAGNTVKADFVSAHPRVGPASPAGGGTFLRVERLVKGHEWTTVATDANWETK